MYFLCNNITYSTIQFVVIKNKVLLYPMGNNIKNTKYNKLNKLTYYLNKRRYSTISYSNNSVEFFLIWKVKFNN